MKTFIPASILIITLLSFIKPDKPLTTLKEFQKALKAGYSYVPQGRTIADGDTTECPGFFMMKGEVTNFEYKEHLFSLKNAGLNDEYLAALPDTSGWTTKNNYNTAMADYYFSHPAYREYPVVNVTHDQAVSYCKWLTQAWRKKTGNADLEFRLPKRSEFLRAANGSAIERPYSWGGPYLRDEKGKFLCNFLTIGSGAISRDSETGEFKVMPVFEISYDQLSSDFTSPSRSYSPNEYGIYNLNGNVAEMVAGENIATGGSWRSPGYDIRNQSYITFSDPSPEIGFRPVMTFVEKSQ